MLAKETLRRGVLWTLLAVSAFASIEPSPYEFVFVLAVLVFIPRGMRFDPVFVPFILTSAIYVAGGLLALTPVVDQSVSVTFVEITVYITLTMIFFALVVADAPVERMETIRSGYICAALLTSTLGVIGYFNVAGLGPMFTLYDNSRAMGTFKDPNVFGPFLVPPIVWLCQDLLLKRGKLLVTSAKLAPLMLGVLLSFSRGAMLDCAASLALLLGLTFLTADTSQQRFRTLVVAICGIVLIAGALEIALSFSNIRDMALERASLLQDYDSGEQGRFGNQIRAIPLLIERPFGFGPLQFNKYFPEDPHEVFLSAFAAGGWLGGFGFAAFTVVTLVVGSILPFRRSSRQTLVIGLWAALMPQILQGVSIDTSHWRHLFLMCGCLMGLAACDRFERAQRTEATPRAVSRVGRQFEAAHGG